MTPEHVRRIVLDEQQRFIDMLDRGRKLLSHRPRTEVIDDETLRFLHQTHGLQREIVEVLWA